MLHLYFRELKETTTVISIQDFTGSVISSLI